ncbi:MAG: hypothetical protein ABEJ22_05145 [Haloferacaceae archaeon]
MKQWLDESYARVRDDGIDGFVRSMYGPYYKLLYTVSRVAVDPTPVYERDWDLLVVLDACRADLLREVADEYEFVESVDEITSVDTMTPEWMRHTFVPEYADQMADTHYVCGNPFSAQILDDEGFETLDELWRRGWDDELQTLPPRAVTDTAIAAARERDAERLVVHYMQPHWPFVPARDADYYDGLSPGDFGGHNDSDVWEQLRRGEVDADDVWEDYRENLRYALDEVEVLLENVDADRAVVTSDHGNSVGEYGIYGHPRHMPFRSLRRVPWVRTTATDERTRDPDPPEASREDDVDADVEARLRNLGYT